MIRLIRPVRPDASKLTHPFEIRAAPLTDLRVVSAPENLRAAVLGALANRAERRGGLLSLTASSCCLATYRGGRFMELRQGPGATQCRF